MALLIASVVQAMRHGTTGVFIVELNDEVFAANELTMEQVQWEIESIVGASVVKIPPICKSSIQHLMYK